MKFLNTAVALLSTISLTSAHLQLTYPLWRGNSLYKNSTFPYGLEFVYPCGGLQSTTNRTKWPVTGGAVAFQPGWNAGHPTAFFYINLGYGNNPPNTSQVMLPVEQLVGPTKDEYFSSVCFPQVPLPVNATVNIGDNATIQVVEATLHGASLYSCADITFADPKDPEIPLVNEHNCFNSSEVSFMGVYTTTSNDAFSSRSVSSLAKYVPLAAMGVIAWALA